MRRDDENLHKAGVRSGFGAAALGAAALALASCAATEGLISRTGEFFSKPTATTTSASGATVDAKGPSPGPSSTSAEEIDCPRVDVRQGAGTLVVNAPGSEGGALALRYQGTFGRAARECTVRSGTVTIKVGVQGRIIVGPAGTGGQSQLNVPLRYALVREGTVNRTIWTKLYQVPVSLPTGALNEPFEHVQEDIVVPVPSAAELDQWIIYVGFDPEGVAAENKRQQAKPRAARQR